MNPLKPLRPLQRHLPATSAPLFVAAALLMALPATAQTSSPPAGAQLASDKGCYNCHGTPPKKNTPTFTSLAKDYAQYQSQPDKAEALADKLRAGPFFGHIDAHERLSAEDALALVRWIISGSPPP